MSGRYQPLAFERKVAHYWFLQRNETSNRPTRFVFVKAATANVIRYFFPRFLAVEF
jgi:hypothetical protein